MEFRLLGSLEVLREGRPLPLGGPQQRAVLALLALHPGEVVSTDRLVDAVWGEEPPPTALTALQGHVSRLRRLLGAGRLLTRAPGYLLAAEGDEVDLLRFERLRARARDEEPAAAAATLRAALELWRGEALADLGDRPGLAGETGRLDELRRSAHEDLVDRELALGRHAELVPRLETLVAEAPFRERSAAQLMLALYRSGRPADALRVYRGHRGRLVERLGLEPGPALRELEQRILRQDPALAPPAAEAGSVEPDRRSRVGVVAVGLAAETAAGGQPDAEAYSRLVTRWREAVRLALEGHGGSVDVARAGGLLLGVFGVPAPREDDALRALAAAAAARVATEQVADELGGYLGLRVRAQIGVAGGETFAGESVAFERALRLREAAAPGEALLDAETREAAADGATVEPAGGGRFRLVAVRPAPVGARRHEQRLVGRRREQRRLRRGFCEIAAGGGARHVGVVGPAGIGKSRLVDELLDSLGDRATVLRTRCLSYGDGIGLLPAVELVRGLAALDADATAELARRRLERLLRGDERAPAAVARLLDLLDLADEPSAPEELSWAVARLLAAEARRRPVVVAIDDVHWADAALLELVEHVVEARGPLPVLVLTTSRTPREPLRAGTISLEPLDGGDCAELVAALLGGPETEPATLAGLVDASGGNPLFLEELVRTLLADGSLRADGGSWRLAEPGSLRMPPTIQALLATRLDQLAPRERDLVARASVVGRTFALAAVEALGADDVDASLAALAEADLVRPSTAGPDAFEFRHLLIRDAAYETLSLELRADLHERHAAWLDGAGDPLALHHLDQAHRARVALAPGDPRLPARAAALSDRLVAAGRRSLARGAAAAAVQLLGRARELGAGGAAAADLGRAFLDVGDFAAADEAFAAAARDAEPSRGRIGRLDVRLRIDPDCDLDAAAAEIDEVAAALAERDDRAGLAEAWLGRAYLALARCRTAELTAALERALPLARETGMGQAESWILFLECAACWWGPAPVDDGIRRCREILEGAPDRPAVEAAALQSLAVLEAMAGRPAKARRLAGESRASRAELGQEVGVAATAIDAGIVELLAGRHADAERVLREGADELESLGEKGYFSTVASLLAEAVVTQGRVEEAARIARASAESATAGDLASQVGWRTAEARCLARAGNPTEAEERAREAVELAEPTDLLLMRGQARAALADVLAAAGRDREADAARAAALAELDRKGLAPRAAHAWARA